MSINELIQGQIIKSFTAEEILLCYIHELREKSRGTEILDTRFSEALEEARAADAALINGEVLGILHGIPVSVKDHLNVADTVS